MSTLPNPLIGKVRPFMGAATPMDTIDAAPLTSTIAAPEPATPAIGASILATKVNLPSRTQVDTGERNRLINTGSGIDQIQNKPARIAARIGDIAASVFAPNVAAFIPGTTLHHNMLVNQATRNVDKDQAQEQNAVDMRQKNALASQEEARAESLADPRKAVDASKTVQTDDGVYQLNPETGKFDIRVGDRVEKAKTPEQAAYEALVGQGKSPLDAFTALNQAKNTKDASFQQQFLDAYRQAHPEVPLTDAISATIRATSTQPKIDVHAAEGGGGGSWQMVLDKDNNPKFFNSKTGELRDNPQGISKPKGDRASVDEQKRADLAKNLNENLSALEDIASRRPELFGPLAGRLTDAKVALGTSDPDVAKLEVIKHQLGMVAQGAHGMRSAQGVESAANSLVNGYHNSPGATRAAISAARESVKTFLDDANNPGASRGEGTPSGPKVGEIVDGYRFKGGNPADQKNWEKQ